MLYDKFTSESDFRVRFLRPLLTRLGFVTVAELHGTQEFGKDFVFSELTPFGFLRNYASVVKHEKTISQTSHSLCNAILSQVRQAFAVTFRLPDTDVEQGVASVVVFNSGKISENARNWLRSELCQERYGRNVHLLDGERLFQLDVSSTFRRGDQLLPRLHGIRHYIQLNLVVWQSITESLPQFMEGRGCFTGALEDFLAAPFLTDKINFSEVATLIQECRIIERINQRYMMPMSPQGEMRDREIDNLRSLISKATERASRVLAEVDAALKTFRFLTNVES